MNMEGPNATAVLVLLSLVRNCTNPENIRMVFRAATRCVMPRRGERPPNPHFSFSFALIRDLAFIGETFLRAGGNPGSRKLPSKQQQEIAREQQS